MGSKTYKKTYEIKSALAKYLILCIVFLVHFFVIPSYSPIYASNVKNDDSVTNDSNISDGANEVSDGDEIGAGDENQEVEEPAEEEPSKIVVVIDPGHGGDNCGAIWEDYTEKELTLKTALAMEAELNKYEGIEVHLTRYDDRKLSLEERVRYAKKLDADFLFCLHYNTSENHKLYGAECWISAFGKYYANGKDFSTIEMNLLKDIGLYDRGIKVRFNSKGTDYYGITRISTAMDIPSSLIEHCHLDNMNDSPYMNCDSWPELYGKTDATAVAKYFGLKSDELGVDYSSEAYVATPVPEKKVRPDETAPILAAAEVSEINEVDGYITLKLSARDEESRILYYVLSFDGGNTYNEYFPWNWEKENESVEDGIYPMNTPSDETVFVKIPLEKEKVCSLRAIIMNQYGGKVETDILFERHRKFIQTENIYHNYNLPGLDALRYDNSLISGKNNESSLLKK